MYVSSRGPLLRDPKKGPFGRKRPVYPPKEPQIHSGHSYNLVRLAFLPKIPTLTTSYDHLHFFILYTISPSQTTSSQSRPQGHPHNQATSKLGQTKLLPPTHHVIRPFPFFYIIQNWPITDNVIAILA